MNIWNFIADKLKDNHSLYLMIVTKASGSSPGKQGFKMAVCDDGSMHGSIGGGAMEYELVEECKSMLLAGTYTTFIKKQEHNEGAADSSGMLCSGKQIVAFKPIIHTDKEIIKNIIQCVDTNKKQALFLNQENFGLVKYDDNAITGYINNADGSWEYNEIIGTKNTIYIIGSGHVGYAMTKQFSNLDFHIVLFDNREGLGMFEENSFAHEKKIIDYANIDSYIPEGNSSYVVIMTSKHSNDKEVLGLLLGKKFKYLGLMGSKAKVSKFKKLLLNEGFTEDDFNNLHAPIGLPINSITPDEIAVSIAAEIIKVKNQN